MENEIKPVKDVKLNKEVLNIIRTTMRNNIDLTQIADNKANVLLSLNALMITFLVPVILSNFTIIAEVKLALPLFILIGTCLLTIYIAVLVLIPRGFGTVNMQKKVGPQASPFFFGNFYKMTKDDFFEYFYRNISDNKAVKSHLTEDLYYVGAVLGRKMTLIRTAFRIFLGGLITSIVLAMVLIIINSTGGM